MPAGYSGTPLVKKLGIKPGYKLYFHQPPGRYFDSLPGMPEDVQIVDLPVSGLNFIQFFTKSRQELAAEFPRLKSYLAIDGMFWISWPKRASRVPTHVDENIIRETGLQHGLVDVKVCAVNDIWSGLKFVYRLKDR